MNPDDPQDGIAAALAKIRAGQQGAPLDDIGTALAKLRAGGGQGPQISHDPALRARQAARGKISDQEQADAADGEPGILGSLADVAQKVPLVGALEAGARSVLRRQPYREAYTDIKAQTDKVPASAKFVGGAAMAIPMAAGGTASSILGRAVPAFLPASAVASGAMLGGASEAFDADPDKGIIGRAATGAAGAAVGGLLGKGLEMGGTALRSIGAKNPAREMLTRQAERAAAASDLYGKAIAEGQGRTGTAAVQKFLAEPDIAEIVGELQQTRPFQGTAADSPEMLDAVYKTLSDRAGVVRKGLESVAPSRPNIGRFRGQDIKAAQSQLLNALETPGKQTIELPAITTAQSPAPSIRDAIGNFWDRIGLVHSRADGTVEQQMARQALERHGAENIVTPPLAGQPSAQTVTVETPPPMSGYRTAVEDYAARTKGMDAYRHGYDAQRIATSGNLPTGRNLTRTTPEALGEWAAAANESTRGDAAQGVMGSVRLSGSKHLLGMDRRALSAAPGTLRSVLDPTQAKQDLLAKLILSFGASYAP